jgi:hypothetical protein
MHTPDLKCSHEHRGSVGTSLLVLKRVLTVFLFHQMWEGLIQKAKDGGLDVIQTYVFWNGHEPTPGNVEKFYTSALPVPFSSCHH